MKKISLRAIIFGAIIFGGIGIATNVSADSDNPTCRMHTNPNAISKGGATTVIWYGSPDVVKATLYPKGSEHKIKVFSSREGWWWMSGIIDDREYTLVVENDEGKTGSCNARVEIITSNDNNNSNSDNENSSEDENSKDEIKKTDNSKEAIVVEVKKKHKSSRCHKLSKHQKSDYKKAYKKVKELKKHDRPTYLEYRHFYEKYRHMSSKKRRHKLGAVNYKKYKTYKRYKKYKKCRHHH